MGLQGDAAATAAGAAAAAAVVPIDAAAAGPREMYGMTSGNTSEMSDIQKVSGMSSVFDASDAPPRARRRGAGEISGSTPRSGTTSRQSSRPPSQAPSGAGGVEGDRLVHRRVDSTSDSYLGRLKQLEEQHEADREAIGCLKDAVVELQAKVSTHDANLAKIRRASDLAAKNSVGVEAAILKRLDDHKSFMTKDLEGKIEKARTHTLKAIEIEMTDRERFGKHLLGHDAPILQPLVEGIMRDKVTEVDGKLKILNAWVAARTHRDGKVEAYLHELHTARPEEGKAVGTAFMAVAQELLEIRAVAGAAAWQSGDAPGAGGGGGGGGGAAPDNAAFEELSKQVAFIQGTLLQGKCHCVHVDQHELRFGAVEQKVIESEKHLRILEGALRHAQRPAAPPQQSTAQCAPCNAGPWPGAAAAAAPAASCPCGPNPWASYVPTGSSAVPPGKQDFPGDGGGNGAPWFVAEACGGNGKCHCVHVNELMGEVEELKAKVDGAHDPWTDGTVGAQYGSGARQPRAKPEPLPLKLGPLGQLYDANAKLFDDKLTSQASFQFDGSKGGATWKGKLERYFISKCPALMKMLSWAEKWEGEKITEDMLARATHGTYMDLDRLNNVNGAVWGFLSNCISGEMETVFKTADTLQGFEAWRRIVRYIEHGKDIKLEGMRNDMKTLHLRPIRSLEQVPIGISEFEFKIKEYEDAGGTVPTESEMKADLLHILPESLRDNLLWRATDPGPYSRFRDMVRSQAARTLLNKQRLPVHVLGDSSAPCPCEHAAAPEESELENIDLNSREGLIAIIKRLGGRPGANRALRDQAPPRGPRKCANCGKEHKELKCPHPRVDVKDRVCWECGGKNHVARDCPQKGKSGKAVRAVDDAGLQAVLARLSVVNYAPDGEGFTRPKRPCKPTPSTATVADFVSHNPFQALSQRERRSARRTPGTDSAQKDESNLDKETQELATSFEQKTRLGALSGGSAVLTRMRVKTGGLTEDASRELEGREWASGAASMDALASLPPTSTGTGGTGRPGYRRAADAGGAEMSVPGETTIGMLEHEQLIGDDQILIAAPDEVKIAVAVDSGAVENVIGQEDLPGSVHVASNTTGRHFVGASNEHIENYGSCDTVLASEHGEVSCEWKVADVSRPLHSISKMTGPADGPGTHDVLFTNLRAVVVPPGIVDKIMKHIKPLVQYDRQGGLYVAEMTLSGFTRPGQGR